MTAKINITEVAWCHLIRVGSVNFMTQWILTTTALALCRTHIRVWDCKTYVTETLYAMSWTCNQEDTRWISKPNQISWMHRIEISGRLKYNMWLQYSMLDCGYCLVSAIITFYHVGFHIAAYTVFSVRSTHCSQKQSTWQGSVTCISSAHIRRSTLHSQPATTESRLFRHHYNI